MEYIFKYNSELRKHEIVAGNNYEVEVVIKDKVCNNIQSTLETVLVSPTDTAVLSTDLVTSGVYEIIITENDVVYNFDYSVHLEILQTIGQNIYTIFCEQTKNCGNCRDLEKESLCNLYLSTFSKVYLFNQITFLPTHHYFEAVNQLIQCYDVSLLQCSLDQEYLTGNYTYSESLVRRIIAFHYIVFYYALTNDDISYLPSYPIDLMIEALDPETILCCIEKDLGIQIEDFNVKTMALIDITISSTNKPPNQVGDYSLVVPEGTTQMPLTSSMFTTDTTPEYFDPEGDLPSRVKILTLPSQGVLLYNSSPVIEDQIIPIADIDAGLLVYQVNTSLIGTNTTTFNFAVADSGSEIFTS